MRWRLTSRILHNTSVASVPMTVLWNEFQHQSYYISIACCMWGLVSDIVIASKAFVFQIPLNTAANMPPTQLRRAPQCTHPTMSILYGEHRCTHCNRPSRLGWVYSCTHDDHNHTTQSEEEIDADMRDLSLKERGDPDCENEEVTLEAVKLKPWMEKAILEGHYTSDQVNILRAQRQKAMRVIAAEEKVLARYIKPAPTPPRSTSLLMAPICETTLPLPATQDSAEEAEVKEPLVVDSSVEVPKPVPACSYKACQVCRPGSRDRAWQRIGGLPTAAVTPEAPFLTVESRRISDANLVRCLGLQKRKFQAGSMSLFPTNDEQDQNLLTDEDRTTEDTAPDGTQAESESQRLVAMGRRAGARSAVRNMMVRPRQDSRDSRTSKESNSSGKLTKRRHSVRDSVMKKYMEKFGRDLGEASGYEAEGSSNYKDWKSIGGSIAKKEKKEKKERGSGLKVNNGVAVTEEAVDLGTAGIIMHA